MPLTSLNFVNKHYIDLGIAITLLITDSPQEKNPTLTIMTELIICSLNIFLV